MLLGLIHILALNIVLLFAPGLYVISIYSRRRLKHVTLEWWPSGLVLFSTALLVLNILLLITTGLLATSVMDNFPSIIVNSLPAENIRLLALDSFFLLISGVLVYISVQNLFTQYVTHEGIVISQIKLSHKLVTYKLLRWEDISDYYLRRDYPVTYFNFLVKNSQQNGYDRIQVQVPFSHLQHFQGILDMNLNLQEEIRERKRMQNRKISKN